MANILLVKLGRFIKHHKQRLINEIKINNNSTTDKQIIADSFSDYFVNVGPNLANNIPASNGDISSYLTGSYMNGMAVKETDPVEIVRLAGSLKNTSSIGSGNILGAPRVYPWPLTIHCVHKLYL